MSLTKLQYDGLLEIRPEEIEDHQRIFRTVKKDGKIYFPFRYISVGYEQRCYSFISKSKQGRKKKITAISQEDHPPHNHHNI